MAKRLELLKEAVPSVTRVAMLIAAAGPSHRTVLNVLEPTARDLGVALHQVVVRGPDDLEHALRTVAQGGAEALMVGDAAPLTLDRVRERIQDFAVAQRLPTTAGSERGYLINYTMNWDTPWRRAAVFIDKILRGARPGDLPMERAAHFELWLDLKVAQELGLTLPESLVLRADKMFPVTGVALPESIRMVPPDRRVVPELAAFAGKWVGTWEGGIEAEGMLIVEAIEPPYARVIVARGNGTVGVGTAHPWRAKSDWSRLRGEFVEGTLQVSEWGATWSYRRQPDGTLAATYAWRGEVSRATMTRVPE